MLRFIYVMSFIGIVFGQFNLDFTLRFPEMGPLNHPAIRLGFSWIFHEIVTIQLLGYPHDHGTPPYESTVHHWIQGPCRPHYLLHAEGT